MVKHNKGGGKEKSPATIRDVALEAGVSIMTVSRVLNHNSSVRPATREKVEKAIAEKYGQEAIVNPKSQWDDDKEKEYLDELKSNYRHDKAESQKVDLDGVLISKELLNRESKRSCPTCNTYSFKSVDDLYMTKFDCCLKCYIQWVEGREERWKKGWRPNK